MSLKGGGVGRFSRQMGGLNKDSCCSSTSNTSTLTWGVRIFIICGILTCISLLWNSELVTDLLVVFEAVIKPSYNNRCNQWNSSHYICLPNVLLIGASKCGTTSIFNYLLFHPHIGKTHRRVVINDNNNEVHKFDNQLYPYIPKPIAWGYEIASSPKVASIDDTIIHYTPQYIYAPSTPYDVREFYPNKDELKFLVLLRDPVQRALSSYWFKNSDSFHSKDRGSEEDFINNFQHEKLTRLEYEACLSQSDYTPYKPNKILSKDLLKKNFNILSSCFGEYFRHGSLGLRHIDKGIYYDQFDRWFQNFHRSQFLIISYEQWLSNPIQYYEKILKFFGHELYGPHGFQSHEDLKFLNLNFLSTSNEKKTTFSDELIHELECYYQKYNQRLNEMLGEEILKIKNLTCEKYESQGGEENKRKMMRTSSSNGEDVDKDQERIKEKKKRYPAPSTSSSIRRN